MINVYISKDYWQSLSKLKDGSLDVVQSCLAKEGIRDASCKLFYNFNNEDETFWLTGEGMVTGIKMKEVEDE